MERRIRSCTPIPSPSGFNGSGIRKRPRHLTTMAKSASRSVITFHQGAGGQGVWPNKNTRAYADKDLAAFDDDGFGFDPDGNGYEAATKSFCSDTWVAKIRSASAGAPLASPIARCGAADNAPVDLTAAPGDETLTLSMVSACTRCRGGRSDQRLQGALAAGDANGHRLERLGGHRQRVQS